MRRMRGFTLIEITIVLVIIGLLAAMVLGGRSMIESAKVSNIVAMAKDVSNASRAFKEKFKYWPGDLPAASNSLPNLPAACNIAVGAANIGNGVIDTADESSCAIEELFQAGMIRADLFSGATFHTLNTEIGAVRLIVASASNVTNFTTGTNVIEFPNLPCSIVLSVDAKVDDGNIAATSGGRGKASVASCVPNTSNDPVPFYAVAIN
jgi:prepilin-type N-terminal cleavage/methylation domain-containing protein